MGVPFVYKREKPTDLLSVVLLFSESCPKYVILYHVHGGNAHDY